ncbi:MAG: autotransporter domain-containing protein [Verrucomicrobia bacterium]|nr:autotransporter domain-containing protein [Verrucomicrobiota bacterium]
MKVRRNVRFLPLLVTLACSGVVSHSDGATGQYWNIGGTGGDGIWGTGPGDKNWNLVAGAAVGNTTWPDSGNDVAVFQDAIGGTVTVFDPVLAAGLSQTGADYTLNAGTITLVPDSAAAAPFIHVQAGTLTVNTTIEGSDGLLKTGGGTLLLATSNNYTGTTTVSAGSINLTGSLASTTLAIASGSSLTDAAGGLAAATVVTNAGTLAINAAETIASLTDNAGTVNGNGALTVTGATIFTGGTLAAPLTLNGLGGGTFTNGSLAGTFIGTAALDGATVSGTVSGNTTSNGNTLVSGSLGGGSLGVTGGVLTLTGISTNPTVTLAAGSSLVDQGNLADTAAVTNAGTFTANYADTIASYISNGGSLTGTALLTTATATLNDGSSVSGKLAAATLSTSGLVALNGTATADTTTITPGTLTLTGTLLSPAVEVKSGAILLTVSGRLSDTTVLTNSGTVDAGNGLSVSSYVSNGGTLAPAAGNMNVSTSFLNDGSFVAGNIKGVDVRANGAVNIGGTITSSNVAVQTGNLTLDGTFVVLDVNISSGAALRNNSSGLFGNSALTNGGTLLMNTGDTIKTYVSNGGSLAGIGTLGTITSTLNDGSSVSGRLSATTLTANGLVSITGRTTAGSFNIASGTLTNTGTLTATYLDISAGTTLVADGTQNFNLLTTSGPGTGTWQGDLANPSTVAPGGAEVIGSLAVTGDFSNTYGGTLKLDLGTGIRDLVTVGGTATFSGTLDLRQLSPITPFVPVQVVAAGDYSGSFSSLTENLDGAVWFNPNNGTVMALAPPDSSEGTLWGTTANQTSVWISLYDDVIDPGTTNVVQRLGGYDITSGPADANNPDLLNALSASFVPGGLNGAVLDRLSPEVYAGFQDYAIQATRSHQRAALDAPSLGFIQAPPCPHPNGSKNALPVPAAANPWEYFAAIDFFDASTDSSPNHADYDINNFGFVAGARTSFSERIRAGGYFAADTGSVDGTLINADATGWSLGVFAKALLDERTHTLVSGGISYGKYEFDGTRGSIVATGGGWTPANTGFSGVDGDALEFYLGASSLAYHSERFRLIPSIGLRFVCGNMEGFAETAGLPGAPIALAVDGDAYHSALAEVSLRAEADLTDVITLHGMIGFSAGINDAPAALTARFATGARPLRVTAAGLDEDAISIGLGATWRVRDNLGLGLDWRADFRSDADMENTLGFSTSVRF